MSSLAAEIVIEPTEYTGVMLIRDFTLEVPTKPNYDMVDITPQVQKRLEESGMRSGVVNLFNVGSTAALTTVEFEPGLARDLEELFEELAPVGADYHHEKLWRDGNGFSHVRASLLKPSLTIPVVEGKMRLGVWQQIVLINFDNRQRTRQVAVQLMGQE